MVLRVYCCFCHKEYFDPPSYPYVTTEEERVEFFGSKHSCKYCIQQVLLNRELLHKENKKAKLTKSQGINKYFSRIFRCFYTTNIIVPQPLQEWFHSKKSSETCTNLFLPKIDRDCLPRFFQLLNGFEQYLLEFSSKHVLKMVKLKPLIVAKTMIFNEQNLYLPFFDDRNLMVTEKIAVCNMDRKFHFCNTKYEFWHSKATVHLFDSLSNSIITNRFIIHAKKVKMYSSVIPPEVFFLLLSPKIIGLKCNLVKFTSSIKFSTLIKRLPNIEELKICDSNIDFDKFWMERLIDTCKNLQLFEIYLSDINLISIKYLEIYKTKNLQNLDQKLYNLDGVNAALHKKFLNFSFTIYKCEGKEFCVAGKKI